MFQLPTPSVEPVTSRLEYPDRRFQLWAYTVGMGRLLLRSTKSETFDSRIDVLFQNVQALQLPSSLPGLSVDIAGFEQAALITAATGLLGDEGRTFFTLDGSGYRGYVVAGVVVVSVDQGEYYEPSEVWPQDA